MVTGYELYRDVIKKCVDPFVEEANSMIEERKEWVDEVNYTSDMYEEFKEEAIKTVACIRSMVDGYLKIACGIADDRFIHRYFNNFLEKLKEGAKAREWQAEQVKDRKKEFEEELEEAKKNDPRLYGLLLEKIEDCNYIIKSLLSEADTFNELYKAMHKFVDTRDMVIWIDKIINMAHERGSMLPVMCGCVLEEYLKHPYQEDYLPDMYGDFCAELCEKCKVMLDCIRYYHSGAHIGEIIMGALALVIPVILWKKKRG